MVRKQMKLYFNLLFVKEMDGWIIQVDYNKASL